MGIRKIVPICIGEILHGVCKIVRNFLHPWTKLFIILKDFA